MTKELLSFDNVVFASYTFYGTVLLLKMFSFAPLTTRKRLAKGAFANPEDVMVSPNAKLNLNDPDVERVRRVLIVLTGPQNLLFQPQSELSFRVRRTYRRNHLNDLENIPAFLLLGFFYVLTYPNPDVAIWHFRVFTAARFLHMVAYQAALPQPTRAVLFLIGLTVCVSMAIQVLRLGKF